MPRKMINTEHRIHTTIAICSESCRISVIQSWAKPTGLHVIRIMVLKPRQIFQTVRNIIKVIKDYENTQFILK
jgi:hypothetical protein